MWIGSKMSKMPYFTIFNKLKFFTMPNFKGTIENPEHISFGVVYELLDSIVSLCTKLEVFSFKLKKSGSSP